MEWTHTSANLQHAKTTARREQSRESDAPEKHWGLGENGGDAVARRPSPPLAGHCTSHPRNIHHEAHARPRCRRGHRARARASEAAGLTRSPPPPRLPRSACHQPRGRSKGSAQRIGARRGRGGRSVGVRTIHPPTPVGRRRCRRGRRSRRPAGTTATHLLRAAPLWRSA